MSILTIAEMVRKESNFVEFIYCGCGCGKTRPKYDSRGRICKYIWGHQNIGKPRHDIRGEKNPQYKGGSMHSAGYRIVYDPDHPSADKYGRVYEHRWVVEKLLGKILEKDENIHHINGVKDDNRIENLQIIKKDVHGYYHAKEYQEKQREKRREVF